jgi:nitroreductase
MDLRDTIRGTGAVRAFTDEPVDDATLYGVLDDARFAPSGGNRQGWRVVVVKDRETRRALGDLMRPVWDEYASIAATGATPFTVVEPASYEMPERSGGRTPNDLLDKITDVPVVLVVGVDLGRLAMMDKDLPRKPIAGGASVYPFCWNVLLAARARGLGGVITTFLLRAEQAAVPVLALPPDHALAAVIFLGHPVHQPTKLRRAAVEEFTTVDRFGGAAFMRPTARPA